MHRFVLLCGLRWGPAGLIASGDDDRGTHVCGWVSRHVGHQCFLCGVGDGELTFCAKISDKSLEVQPRRPVC